MPPRFRIVYVETPSLADLIERYRAAHLHAVELWALQRRLRNDSMRRRCESVVRQSHLLRAHQGVRLRGA